MTAGRFQKILCPVDFSPPSHEALRAAAELAAQSGGSLTIFHAYELPSYLPTEETVMAHPRLRGGLLTSIEAALEQWRDEARAAGARDVETVKVEGPAWQEIVRRADVGRYSLVVLGTHGRTGLKHALLGSVAEKVVQHAPCAVLAVRRPAGHGT